MLRKLFKTANSIVISIPKDILNELNLSEGESVSVELDSKQLKIVISPIESPLTAGVDDTFARQIDGFIKEYRPALQALASDHLADSRTDHLYSLSPAKRNW